MWPKYKSKFKKCLTKITSISTNLKNAKCTAGQRDKKHFNTGLHTETGYPVQTSNLYLTLTFLDRKGNYYVFMIFNYQELIESRNRKPSLSESAVADFVLHFTLIFGS